MPTPLSPFVYLASQSPRRAALLQQIGVAHRPLLPEPGDEAAGAEALEAEQPGEMPTAYVERVVLLKLAAASARLQRRGLPPAPILCADTTVAVGRRILGKPAGDTEALRMLRTLAGHSHRVMTAVAVASGRRQALKTSVSRVRFAPMSDVQLQRYVDSGEPQGKAGAYAVQGRIAAFIERIDGSHSGIMGLPLHETALLLADAGVEMGV